MITMDLYATHQSILAKYLLQAEGNVIELGSGNYSTPLIHAIAAHRGLHAETIDTDDSWLNQFRYLETESNIIRHIKQWSDFTVDKTYSVAFVDHADPPNHPRWIQVLKLIPYSSIIIVHDCEDPLYGYVEIMNMVDIVEVFSRHLSQTLVLRPKHRAAVKRITKPVVSISTWRMTDDTTHVMRAVESCKATSDVPIVIHDDGSCDEYQQKLREIPGVDVVLSVENTGIAKTKNRGLSLFASRPDVDAVFLCDDDIVFTPGWCERYCDAMETVPILAACERNLGHPEPRQTENFDVFTHQNGAFVAVSRRVFDVLGYYADFPAKYGIEHVEYYCRAILAGLVPWRGFWDVASPDGNAVVAHKGSKATLELQQQRSKEAEENRLSPAWLMTDAAINALHERGDHRWP